MDGPSATAKTTCGLRVAPSLVTRYFPLLVGIFVLPAAAFDPREIGEWSFTPSIEMRFGLQYGTGINFGLGAIDDLTEKERSSLSLSLEPALGIERDAFGGTFYSGVSIVGATNVLDGELSGQFARSGDSRIDIDEAHVGWRNDKLDLSVGPQVLVIGDGLVLGDGNFDIGAEQGQFWVAPFNAWKNAAILKVSGERIHTDLFWLRSDGGFGDARLFGVNLENTNTTLGRYGVMYINIYDGDALSYDGVQAWNVRALDVPVPRMPPLKLYGEVVIQVGEDDDGVGADNAGLGWYLEAAYTLPRLPWTTILTYRYAHFSGDNLDTRNNETYRSLFYGFYAREWDTFYQGEIAGEYHLFNSNQITQFLKLRTFPTAQIALTAYYFQHDLEERHYFGTPVSSSDWADEINLGIEYFSDHKVYLYAGIAWSSPNAGAREIFGDEDFTVIQTWMSFHF